MKAIVSIHDVMPATLAGVTQITHLIAPANRPAVSLLVVPGLNWSDAQLDQLRAWQHQGFELAGHGWRHQSVAVKTLYHRAHSALFSRDAAEHLSLTRAALRGLLLDNHQWFERHHFKMPQFYVPPAWALGKLKREDLTSLPFRYYENAGGIFDAQEKRYRRLPLLGFEADTRLRQCFLRAWNHGNKALCSRLSPIRIAVHPFDLQYRLGGDLKDCLATIAQWQNYRTIF